MSLLHYFSYASGADWINKSCMASTLFFTGLSILEALLLSAGLNDFSATLNRTVSGKPFSLSSSSSVIWLIPSRFPAPLKYFGTRKLFILVWITKFFVHSNGLCCRETCVPRPCLVSEKKGKFLWEHLATTILHSGVGDHTISWNEEETFLKQILLLVRQRRNMQNIFMKTPKHESKLPRNYFQKIFYKVQKKVLNCVKSSYIGRGWENWNSFDSPLENCRVILHFG